MTRVSITIEVDCDALPGMLHEPVDWLRYFERHCRHSFPHYNPEIVNFTVVSPPLEAPTRNEEIDAVCTTLELGEITRPLAARLLHVDDLTFERIYGEWKEDAP